jgi:hypothetical protein
MGRGFGGDSSIEKEREEGEQLLHFHHNMEVDILMYIQDVITNNNILENYNGEPEATSTFSNSRQSIQYRRY